MELGGEGVSVPRLRGDKLERNIFEVTMPWSNPSNHNPNREPKKPGSQKAPPDLEDILKKFFQSLDKMFKKPAGNSGSPSNSIKHMNPAHLIGGVIFLLWLLLGIFIVAPAEEAVVLRFGQYQATLEPGPHWIPRLIESVYIVNEQKISNYAYEAQMLTKDENIVSVALAVQYRISNARDYLFNVVNPSESLQQATASALRQVIGRTTLDEVLTKGRDRIRQEVTVALNNILTKYKAGLVVTDVAMQPARAPDEVKEAFDDAIKAQEDEQRFINQAQAYAMQVVPTAKGQAQRLLADAKGYKEQTVFAAKGDTATFLAILPEYQKAPNVTRERLYLEMMESVLSATSKVLLNSGGNPLLYLPLDKAWLPSIMTNKPFPFALNQSRNDTGAPKESNLETVTTPAVEPERITENQNSYSQRGYN
jgi:membrane protease subunit HflK